MDFSHFQKNISLALLTTFKIGGPADYFFVAKSEDDLIDAVSFARQEKLPVFILGGGSNILVSDEGFRGLVIQIKNSCVALRTNKLKTIGLEICADAGVPLAELVRQSAKSGLAGLEWAVGIPGTLGGAIFGNAGAFGLDMSSVVRRIRVYSDGFIKQYNCHSIFKYRDSIFKHNKEIILSADLVLQKSEPEKIKQTIKNYLEQRRSKQPWEPSAGSVFKNIVIDSGDATRTSYKNLAKMVPSDIIKGGKIPGAYLIEQCGLLSYQVGQAQISPKHANFIINLGGAKASDVLGLIQLVKNKVKEKFGVELEEEIELVGF